jgi:DnaJ-class molecular chaperone
MKRKNCIVQRKSPKELQAEQTCIACNGSGRYDHDGSPPCGQCNGTGLKSSA